MADVAGRALLLGLLVVAARTLTAPDFGRYAYAVAVGLICAQLASGGLQVALLRRLSISLAEPADRQAFGDALRARTAAGSFFAIVAAALAAVAGDSAVQSAALAAIAAAAIVSSHGEMWLQAARAAGRVELEALAGLIGRGMVAVAGTAALVVGGGLAGLAVAYVAGSLLGLLAARAVAQRIVFPQRGGGWRGVWSWYRESLPLVIAAVASLLMFRVDAVLLEWLRGPADVGLYTVAYRPFEATLLVSVAAMATAFPELTRLSAAPPAFAAFTVRVGGVLLALAATLAVVGWWAGPPLLELAFGAPYAAAGGLLRILLVALVPMYLNALLTHALIALGRPWLVALAMGVAFAVNVSLNLLLIPQMGATGAAIATVFAESALFAVALGSLAAPMLRARARPARSG